jgi:putative ABC transport system substrate-binding protein
LLFLAATVKELERVKCDVIVANSTPAALAVKASAPATPLVFLVGGDPVDLGLVASLARPGGNATGMTYMSIEAGIRLFGLLRQVVPAAKRIAVMFEAGNPSMLQIFKAQQSAASAVGITLSPLELRDWKDVEVAHLSLLREPADGMIVLYDRITSNESWKITHMARELRLPAAYGSRHFVDDWGLLSYGINWPAMVARAADYVARILNGEKPAELPVEQPTQFELLVNQHMARVQGITIPQSVLLQATEVIQ